MKKLLGIVLTSLALGGTAIGTGVIVEKELDIENGKPVYEVEVEQGGYETEYEVDATTGAVLETEKDRDDVGEKNQTTNTTTQKQSQSQAPANDIGRDKAKEIALQEAGVTADQVVWEEVERDYDDGRLEYQVEFRVGNKEYDYEIDAATGNILERDFDRDDDRWDN